MRALAFLFVVASFGVCSAPMSTGFATTPQSPIEHCLTLAADDESAQNSCIGSFASSCIDTSPGGQSTAGMVQCVDAERAQWENARGATVTILRANETPTQIALLDASLAEHARWTQTRCRYEASIYEGGSLSLVVAAQCVRDAVAEHTLYLRNRYSED